MIPELRGDSADQPAGSSNANQGGKFAQILQHMIGNRPERVERRAGAVDPESRETEGLRACTSNSVP